MSVAAGTAIREWREGQGLSQATCAKRVGVAQSAWNQWETGKGEPRVRFAVRLELLTGGAVPVAMWCGTSPDESGPLPTADVNATGTDS